MSIPKQLTFAGAGSPTLQTALTNYNTAATTNLATATATANYIPNSALTTCQAYWDGTNNVIIGTINFLVSA